MGRATQGASATARAQSKTFAAKIEYEIANDRITVLMEDGPTIKHRDGPFTLLERKGEELDEKSWAGFAIESARAFCEKRGLVSKGWTKVSDILRFMTVFAGTSRYALLIEVGFLPALKRLGIDKFEFPD